MNTSHSLDSDRYCVFSYGTSSWLAVPAASVREVCCLPPLVRFPGVTGLLAGVGHLRNEFIPVVRLDGSVRECPESRVIVLTGPQGTWGILAQRVAPLQAFEVTPTSQNGREELWSSAQLGSAVFHNEVVTVVEPNRMYRALEHQFQQHWQASQPGAMHVSLHEPSLTTV